MSLRSNEEQYQKDIKEGKTTPLHLEDAIYEFNHWKMIDNRYPYDTIYSKHHMLIPKRIVAKYRDLSFDEIEELRDIIDSSSSDYDLYFENMPAKRSVKSLFHIHLAKY